jgi:hypothetical protein
MNVLSISSHIAPLLSFSSGGVVVVVVVMSAPSRHLMRMTRAMSNTPPRDGPSSAGVGGGRRGGKGSGRGRGGAGGGGGRVAGAAAAGGGKGRAKGRAGTRLAERMARAAAQDPSSSSSLASSGSSVSSSSHASSAAFPGGSHAEAIHDFAPDGVDPQQMGLSAGDRLSNVHVSRVASDKVIRFSARICPSHNTIHLSFLLFTVFLYFCPGNRPRLVGGSEHDDGAEGRLSQFLHTSSSDGRAFSSRVLPDGRRPLAKARRSHNAHEQQRLRRRQRGRRRRRQGRRRRQRGAATTTTPHAAPAAGEQQQRAHRVSVAGGHAAWHYAIAINYKPVAALQCALSFLVVCTAARPRIHSLPRPSIMSSILDKQGSALYKAAVYKLIKA